MFLHAAHSRLCLHNAPNKVVFVFRKVWLIEQCIIKQSYFLPCVYTSFVVRNVTKTTKRELSWLEEGQAAAGGLVDGEIGFILVSKAEHCTSGYCCLSENSLHLNTFYRLTTRKHVFCSLLYLDFYLVVQSNMTKTSQISTFWDAPQQCRFRKIMFETVKKCSFWAAPSKRNHPKPVFSFYEKMKPG